MAVEMAFGGGVRGREHGVLQGRGCWTMRFRLTFVAANFVLTALQDDIQLAFGFFLFVVECSSLCIGGCFVIADMDDCIYSIFKTYLRVQYW